MAKGDDEKIDLVENTVLSVKNVIYGCGAIIGFVSLGAVELRDINSSIDSIKNEKIVEMKENTADLQIALFNYIAKNDDELKRYRDEIVRLEASIGASEDRAARALNTNSSLMDRIAKLENIILDIRLGKIKIKAEE